MSARWKYQNSSRGGLNGFIRSRGKTPKKLNSVYIPRLNQNNNYNGIDDKREGPRVEMNAKDYQDETVLCFSFGSSLLGAAIYEQSTQIVRVMNDISEDTNFEYIKRLIDSIKPSIILANQSQDMKLINMLTARYGSQDEQTNDQQQQDLSDTIPRWDPTSTIDETDEQTTGNDEEDASDDEFENTENVKLVKLSNNFFRFKKAMGRLNDLFNADDSTSTAEEKEMMVRMRIDMNSTNMIRSFGALLFYLDETRLGVESEPLNVRTSVKSIKTFLLENHVEIDFNTFKALDIMHNDEKKKRGVPQKYSLFSLLNRCKSSVGRRCLKKWFRNPTTNRDVLRIRHKFIHFFIQDCHRPITARIIKCLNHVKGLDNIFHRFQTGTASLMHWDGFIQTISSLCEIIEALQLTPLREHLFEDEVTLRDISELIVIIKSIIDFEESRNEGRVAVCCGVDNYLDEYKCTFRSLPSALTTLAEQEAERLGISQDEKCSCMYIPLLGYLIALPKTFPIDEHDNITLVYETESELRVKNRTTEFLEEEIGDIRMQIIDREASILLRLKKMIMRKRRKIMSFLNLASQIDVYISMGAVASELGWNCPNLVDEPVLEATSLYHPLASLITKKEFVPNRVISGSDGTRVSIITGPNACGKSVYMKQVGVLAFLAHIGSFVPARHTRIGPIDRIVTRMFTVDTVLDGMSTFAKDVEQVAVALRKSTVNSLVIVDEFGKGTMMEVGLSLLASTLTHWIEKGPEKCPHVFVSSHFHALPKYIPVDNTMVAFLTFRVDLLSGGRTEYSFKLVEGVVDCSFAMTVAKDEGIEIEDVGRACHIYERIKDGGSIASIKMKLRISDNSEELENGERLLEDDFIDQISKAMLRTVENKLKDNARRTLADDNLVGDTQGVDQREWDETQNLIREEVGSETFEKEEAEKRSSEPVREATDVIETLKTTENWVKQSSKMKKNEGLERKKTKNNNLSVSFALPPTGSSKSNSTKEPSDLFQFLEEVFEECGNLGKEPMNRKEPMNSNMETDEKSCDESKYSQVNVTRQETPPSPMLFSDVEEEEEEVTSKLTEESIKSPSQDGPIFSTPLMEAARKRLKLDTSRDTLRTKTITPPASVRGFKTPLLSNISRNYVPSSLKSMKLRNSADLSVSRNIPVETINVVSSQKSATRSADLNKLSQISRNLADSSKVFNTQHSTARSVTKSVSSQISNNSTKILDVSSAQKTTPRSSLSRIPSQASVPFQTTLIPDRTPTHMTGMCRTPSQKSLSFLSMNSTPVKTTPKYSSFRPVSKRLLNSVPLVKSVDSGRNSPRYGGLVNRSFETSMKRTEKTSRPSSRNNDGFFNRELFSFPPEKSNITPRSAIKNQSFDQFSMLFESQKSEHSTVSSSSAILSNFTDFKQPGFMRTPSPSTDVPSSQFKFEMNDDDPVYGKSCASEPMDTSFGGFSQVDFGDTSRRQNDDDDHGDFEDLFNNCEKSLFVDSQAYGDD